MNPPPSFSLQQMLEAMPLVFNPGVFPDLRATVQFNISAPEPGVYSLQIDNNGCTFHNMSIPRPTLVINAPSDVWLGIMRGEINGQEALIKGLYSAQGDFSLLQKWSTLFGGSGDMRTPAIQRPAGPLKLSGALWMTLAFIPWILHWIFFGSFGIPPLASIGVPWLLSAVMVGYRLRYNRPDWLETGGLAFFTLGGVLYLVGMQAFQTWGSTWSNLCMGGLWLASLLFSHEPLSMKYIKWQYERKLWSFSLFIHINAAISLLWGFQSIAAAAICGLGVVFPSQYGIFTVLRYLTLLPAYYFTNWYPKVGMQKPVKDTQLAMRRFRLASGVGLASAVALLLWSLS
jgi:hypothetical protein